MKIRIISGIVMGVIVAAVLAVGFLWNPVVITAAIALLAAGAVYELLHNAAGIKIKTAWIGACVYSFLMVFCLNDYGYSAKTELSFSSYVDVVQIPDFSVLLSVIYFIFSVFVVLANHKEFNTARIAALFAFPLPYAYAFFSLDTVINNGNGIYYLLLLLNFSSVCDMGAYFTGVTCGKHKLCPNISPKKTVEGAVGGVISSIIVTVILSLCFNKSMLLPIVLTVPFCVLGMVGDLFASVIKRSVGLKDYGNLIPGHGGILDRMDSIIMIAPVLDLCIKIGVI